MPEEKKKIIKKIKKIKPAKTEKKTEEIEKIEDDAKKYCEAVGRRKQATARVRLFTCRPFEGDIGKMTVNGKPYTEFFPTFELSQSAASPLIKMKSLNRFEVTVIVKGGGIRGQAEAIRHGLSRTLVKFNPDFSKKLKRAGFLMRDPRKKERKNPDSKKPAAPRSGGRGKKVNL